MDQTHQIEQVVEEPIPRHSEPAARGRRPIAAVLLSLLMPGLGHVYCGRFVEGIVLTFLAGLSLPILISRGAAMAETPAGWLLIGSFRLLSFLAWTIAVIDSWFCARRRRRHYELRDYNRWYIYCILIMMHWGGTFGYWLYINDRYFEAYVVPSASMYPTIVPGDRLVANKTAYQGHDPELGDLILFPNPENRSQKFIKRVVALPGDVVLRRDDRLTVNGIELVRERVDGSAVPPLLESLPGRAYYETNGTARYMIYLAQPPEGHSRTSPDFGPYVVPANHVFVMGDNRNLSMDSRHFGPVPLIGIDGRFDFVLYPAVAWSRFGKLQARQP